jgi:hypothetical protein
MELNLEDDSITLFGTSPIGLTRKLLQALVQRQLTNVQARLGFVVTRNIPSMKKALDVWVLEGGGE